MRRTARLHRMVNFYSHWDSAAWRLGACAR